MHVHVAYNVNNPLLVRVIVMYKSNNEKDTSKNPMVRISKMITYPNKMPRTGIYPSRLQDGVVTTCVHHLIYHCYAYSLANCPCNCMICVYNAYFFKIPDSSNNTLE